MIQLPPFGVDAVDQSPVYDYTIPLGERTYRVVLTYRGRQDRWYLDLYTVAQEPIVLGTMLAVDVFLLEDLRLPELPEGKLALFDTSGAGLECGWDDLGARCELVYLDPADLPAPAADPDLIVEQVP